MGPILRSILVYDDTSESVFFGHGLQLQNFSRYRTSASRKKILKLATGEDWWIERKFIRVPEKMEIDLGGVEKEYAADRIARLFQERFNIAVLVNLGRDCGEWEKERPFTLEHRNRTGWPEKDAPHSVTVAAGSCTEAGLFFLLRDVAGETCRIFSRSGRRAFLVQAE